MDILKVCFITTSFPAIFFFYDSVIISRKHLKKSTCRGNCVYFTTLFSTAHCWRICLFQENHCGPALLQVPIYSTELVAIYIFFLKSTAFNAQKHLQRSHSFMVNQHSKFTITFSKILKHSALSKG